MRLSFAFLLACALVLSLVTAVSGGCSDPDEARRHLSLYRFRELRMTGYAWVGCGEGDYIHDGFEAVTQEGVAVEGIVCCGFLKGCTVRLR